MDRLIRYLAIAVLLGAGCGGGANAPRADAAPDAQPAWGADVAAGTCANLACLHPVELLMLDCAGTATCTLEKAGTPATSTTQCFDNGVKILTTGAMTSGPTGYTSTTTFAVKKGDSLCYTRTMVTTQSWTDAGLVPSVEIVTQDASGTTLVSAHQDENDVVTVTCPGGEPTGFVDSCGFSESAARAGYLLKTGSPPTCTEGACSF